MLNLIRRLALALAFAAGAALASQSAGAAPQSAAQTQFPTSGWGAYASDEVICGQLIGANFNTTADQPIPISVPTNTYTISLISVSNASVSLTTAAGGFYQSAAKAGTVLVAAGQAYSTLTAAALDSAGGSMTVTLAAGGSTSILDLNPIYFSLTTPQGAAATADIRIYCRPRY